MSRKKILIVGNGNHQFITNYVHWVKKGSKGLYTVDVLSSAPIHMENNQIYNGIFPNYNNSHWFQSFLLKTKGISRYYRFYLYKKSIPQLTGYDIIHFHFIGTDSYFLINYFKKNSVAKIIFSIWGSDMYRVNSTNEKKFIGACRKADVLTFANEKSIDYFKTKFDWTKNNLYLCRFGLAPLEDIKDLALTKNDCKQQLSWNNNKLAVTIGYNLSQAQQHLEILTQFEHEKIKRLADKIQLILPITYGGTSKYKRQLLDKLSQLPFEYTVYDTFLTDEKVALIRKASDIMIQVQKTDQFSGSMQEHLFARNVVITGSWLPYETIKEHGGWFIEIDKLDELSNIISLTTTNYKEYEAKTLNNPQIISKLSSWVTNIHKWIALYSN